MRKVLRELTRGLGGLTIRLLRTRAMDQIGWKNLTALPLVGLPFLRACHQHTARFPISGPVLVAIPPAALTEAAPRHGFDMDRMNRKSFLCCCETPGQRHAVGWAGTSRKDGWALRLMVGWKGCRVTGVLLKGAPLSFLLGDSLVLHCFREPRHQVGSPDCQCATNDNAAAEYDKLALAGGGHPEELLPTSQAPCELSRGFVGCWQRGREGAPVHDSRDGLHCSTNLVTDLLGIEAGPAARSGSCAEAPVTAAKGANLARANRGNGRQSDNAGGEPLGGSRERYRKEKRARRRVRVCAERFLRAWGW